MTYSVLQVEVVTRVCCFELQDMGPFPKVKMYPDVERHVLVHPAKSESVYPVRQISHMFPSISARVLHFY